ncbi:MAG: polyhydroxyalkanoate synthesis repressor PhaR [Caulobacteraceae bacterium]|nr:polyhydroxyalkanoate synthesis repressor PhaR [Caulobacteraceae bacterium]
MSDQKKTGSEPSGAKAKASANGAQGRVVIKKYANRRLYNTASSSYVTLEHLSEMVKEGVDFVVFDAKTNEDITRSVLTQIIFDEESRGQNLLPIQFLRQLIGFYGNSMQAFLPSYLELSLDSFTRQQERMRTQMGAIAPGLTQGLTPNLGASLGTVAGPQFLEEQVKQNLAMFDRAMKMFSPFAYVRPEDSDVVAPPAPTPTATTPAATDDSLNDLKKKIEEMQEQISRLASKG